MLDEAKTNEALDEMRAILRADGGDMRVTRLDLLAAEVQIELILDDARCRECVLPRPMLENVVGHIMNDNGVAMTKIIIDDPREATA